jgi:pentatricopeptide repeat protein
MKELASVRNIAGTMRIFRTLEQSGAQMTSIMYDIVLQAWINSGNIQAAEDWMEDIQEAGMATLGSFNTLIKTLVMTHAFERARSLLQQMRDMGIQPSTATFNELINGCAQESYFHDGLSLLEDMLEEGTQTNTVTLDAIAKLLNGCRGQAESNDRVRQILRKFKLEPNSHNNWSGCPLPTGSSKSAVTDIRTSASSLPIPVPRLVVLISRADDGMHKMCQHEVEITGTLSQIKTARRTFKQHGFLDENSSDAWPLNGHWETDHGLTVVIEGKLVRWSRQRASRLHFAGENRRSCVLALYGSPTRGQLLVPGISPGATKTLRWENGDAWHSYEGRVIGQAILLTQTMTKVVPDSMQDQAYRARTDAMLRCVCKNGLCVPQTIEDAVMQFLGNSLYYVRVRFESKWNPRYTDIYEADADTLDIISRRNPRVGIRHCWTEPDNGCYGQRTLVNGEEVDEECFNRHVKLVWRT